MAAPGLYDLSVYDTATYDSFTVGAPTVELFLNGVWTDITAYVRVSDGITIRRGVQSWQSAPVPATCTMTLDNADGRFTPRYASGAYYPYLIRNTQLRVSVRLDDGSNTVRFWGQVPSWPISWDLTARDVRVQIEAAGIRRRLTVTQQALASPLRTAIGGLSNVVAYWPMEDGDTAMSFGSAVSGAPALLEAGASLAADTTFVASTALPTFGDGASFGGVVPSYTFNPSGTQALMVAKVTGATGGFSWRLDTAGSCWYVFDYAPGTDKWTVNAFNYVDGSSAYTVAAFAITGSAGFMATGVRVMFDLAVSGSDVRWGIILLAPGAGSGVQAHDTVVGATLGRIVKVSGYADVAGGATAVVGHLSVENGNTNIFDLGQALNAYVGETASARATRLAASAGLAITVAAGAVSTALGAQGEDTILGLIDEAAGVDGGISTEALSTFGLVFRARSDMYANNAVGQFPYTKLNTVSPIDDDQNLINDVTVARPTGSSARYVATAGLTPAVVGTYADSLTLNLYADTQLADQAGWRANVGSVDRPRWQVGFDALRLITLDRTHLASMREGDTYGVTSVPSGLGGANPDIVRILGWSETIRVAGWDFEVNAVPGEPFSQVFILDSASFGVLDTNRLGL